MQSLNKIFFCVGVGFCFSLLFLFPHNALASEITEENIYALINSERQKSELQPLVPNDILSHVASLRATDMLENNYFSHQSPNGLMPWDIATIENYEYSILGENLALDYYNAEEVINDWMASPNHRNNILNPLYSETGIEVIQNSDNLLIVQIFAQPKTFIYPGAMPLINNSVNDQSLESIIPNNDNIRNLTVLGAYDVKNPINYENNNINMYNLWIFLLTLAFFPISLYFILIPDKISIN